MVNEGDVRVVASLRPYLDEYAPDIARCGLRMAFEDAADVAAAAEGAAAVVVPATTPPETGLVRSVRAGHFLLPIIGVVQDRTGHQTYDALGAGATTVLNLLLPARHRVEALHSALAQRPPAGSAGGSAGRPVPPFAVADPDPGGPPAALRENDLLIELLCGPQTVSAIARQFFCSERSLYRRIRRLYDDVGVAGRAELRMEVGGRRSRSAPSSNLGSGGPAGRGHLTPVGRAIRGHRRATTGT